MTVIEYSVQWASRKMCITSKTTKLLLRILQKGLVVRRSASQRPRPERTEIFVLPDRSEVIANLNWGWIRPTSKLLVQTEHQANVITVVRSELIMTNHVLHKFLPSPVVLLTSPRRTFFFTILPLHKNNTITLSVIFVHVDSI